MGDPFHDKESKQFVARYIRLREDYGETHRVHSLFLQAPRRTRKARSS